MNRNKWIAAIAIMLAFGAPPYINKNAMADSPVELPLPPAPAPGSSTNATTSNAPVVPAVPSSSATSPSKTPQKSEKASTSQPKEAPETVNDDNQKKVDEAVLSMESTFGKSQVVPISGKAPYYVDNGTTMVPIRPISDFLGLNISYRSGIVSISGILQSFEAAPTDTETEVAPQGHPIFVNFRTGSNVAQIIEGIHNRTSTLEAAPETRLGITFVPLRFVATAFNAKVAFDAKNSLITVQKGDRIGYLRQPDQCDANVPKTVTLTVANRVGRAFTLQLKGPCDFRIELGRLQKVTAKLPAGLYEYTAVSEGVYPKRGKRWLRKGAKVNWSFGG